MKRKFENQVSTSEIFKNNKNKIIALVIGLVILVSCGTVYALTLKNEPIMKLKHEVLTFEYGEEIKLEAKDIVIVEDKKILKDVGIAIQLELEKDQTYTPVGNYEATATYKDLKLEFEVIVEDTTAPKFIDFKESYTIEKDNKLNYEEVFKIEDLSSSSIKVNDKEIDYQTVGTYKGSVVATDKYENTTKKNFNVEVTDKEITVEPEEDSAGSTINNSNSNNGNEGTVTPTQPPVNPPAPVDPPNVCVPGVPNPSEIGNSGLVFYSRQEYSNWFQRVQANNGEILWEEYGKYGFDGYTLSSDTCGNMLQDLNLEYWTVSWHD